MKKLIPFFFLIFIFNVGYCQLNFPQPDNIKTVILKPTTTNSYAPIIKLGENIQLTFDDLNADEHTYYYKIEHCDFDWTVSNLLESEFVNGYAEDRILDYENSFNTLQPFTNYTVTIPNENTELKISGNYIISVLNEDEQVVFKRAFVVYESKVTVGAAVYRSRDISTINSKQSIEFTINNSNFRINNPSEEIRPVILQNNNWQTAIMGLKPQFYRGTELLYKYNKETSFYGGNEFLYFDSKSIRNSSLNIVRAELEKGLYHTYLYTNEERINRPYTLFEDVNGNFIIRNLSSDTPNTDADYSWVHFSLSCLENLDGKDIYVSGSYNNWELNDLNKLTYNPKTGLYEVAILLKQGFYNYQYVTKNKAGYISNYDIDGSFHKTENDYTVLIYYKGFGNRYTQVIGVGFANSEKLNN
ncbi:type IX secretion system plug protein domain-containing protein [Lutibacter sp.]|uniref:type IX secretion system plug protein n=1 Tax=Lutibacter sp. TaxID=1925666 RepID=UPI0035664858